MSESLEHGRRLKCLTIVDAFTKEGVDVVVDHGISGHYVTRALDAAARFRCLPEARAIVATWRTDYNERRPHSALDYQTPAEFAAGWRARTVESTEQETQGLR